MHDIGKLSARYFDEHLGPKPLLAILRGKSAKETVRLCRQAWSIGIELVEVPIQDRAAVISFRAAHTAAKEHGKHVGAGTVLTTDQVRLAVEEGAMFAVSPSFDQEVIEACEDLHLPMLPGVATSTEISRAARAGLLWQKAFPAAELGPRWISAQLGPFPSIRFVATGGVDAVNAPEFLAAGARAVAVGSALGDAEKLALFEDLSAPALGESEAVVGDAS